MDADRWDRWLERTILALVLGALGLAILAFGGVRVRDFLRIEALVALAAAVWLVRVWTVRGQRLLWPPVSWGVLVFAGFAAWRALSADLPYVAWGELIRILTYTTLFFVVVNNLHRQDTTQFLSWSLVALATALCFYGAFQFATSNNTVWGFDRGEGYAHRASGSYVCPNHFAGLLAMLTPTALAVVLAGRVKPVTRILLGYAVAVMLVGVGLTFSRGGILATGIGLAFLLIALLRQRDNRWPALACLVVLLGAGAVAAYQASPILRRHLAAGDFNTESRNSRIAIWRAACGMWQDHPWLGVGPAHFNERFKQYRTFWANGEPERAHNDYLDALADWGVLGTGLAALPWFLFGYGVTRTLRQVRRDPGDLEVKRSSRYAFVIGGTAGLVALAAHSMVDFNLHIPANAMVAITLMALMTGYSRYATDDWWVSSRRPWRLAITLVMGALLATHVLDLRRRGRETTELVRAQDAPAASEAQIANLRAAWAIEPRNAMTAYEIGEALRRRSFVGGDGHERLALEALDWFRRAAALHPFQPVFPIRAGMCLDWIGRHDEAAPLFQTAHRLDPEGRITSFYLGWHEFQAGNVAAAWDWFVKSTQQGFPPYPPAERYLQLIEQRSGQH